VPNQHPTRQQDSDRREADSGGQEWRHRLAGEFDPESGLRLTSRLTAAVDALFHDAPPATCPTNPDRKQGHLRALALLRLVLGRDAVRPSRDASGRDGSVGSNHASGSDDESGHEDPDEDADVTSPSTSPHVDAHRGDRSTQMPAPTVDMVVVIDLATLCTGMHGESHIDTGFDIHLPVETLRRMACTANIIPAVLDGDGVLLDLGRRRRLASTDQRRALQTMYRTCGVDPACRVPFHQCEPHHIDYWTRDDGPTDLRNLLPACSFHHHAVHEGGWILELRPSDRRLTVTNPDGSVRHVWPDTAHAGQHPSEAA